MVCFGLKLFRARLRDDGGSVMGGASGSFATAIGAVRPVAVNTTVSPDLAMDGGAMSTKPTRDLAAAQTHLHQAAQAASLLKREIAVSRSHGDPGHSRCRTWFVNLRCTLSRKEK